MIHDQALVSALTCEIAFISSLADETLEQPWKGWYVANESPAGSVQFVVPVMAAGNLAPASRVNGRLDLSKPKAPEGGDENTRR